MAWFRRRKAKQGSPGDRPANRGDIEHLENFVRSRRGVEAFIEPRTTVTETTLVLVAHDGEWTRRRIDGPEGARQFAHRLAIPVYDVALVGYPKRMREFNERRRQAARAAAQGNAAADGAKPADGATGLRSIGDAPATGSGPGGTPRPTAGPDRSAEDSRPAST